MAIGEQVLSALTELKHPDVLVTGIAYRSQSKYRYRTGEANFAGYFAGTRSST